jgi:hypothetical protein
MVDEEERKVYELRMQTLADSAALIVSAEEKGRKKGIAEGEHAAKLAMARQLLDLLDDETIAERIGVKVETVAGLRREGSG